jgi:hypothetical protein
MFHLQLRAVVRMNRVVMVRKKALNLDHDQNQAPVFLWTMKNWRRKSKDPLEEEII